MKPRLIAQKRPPEVNQPASEVWAIDPDAPIPEGWEEVEIVPIATLEDLSSRAESSDPCTCQHTRSLHLSHSEACLKLECPCKQFEEAA